MKPPLAADDARFAATQPASPGAPPKSAPAAPVETSSIGWTLRQRQALLLVLTLLLAFLAVRYARSPTYVSDPQPERPARYADLADRIDPNTADVPSLAALPTLGKKRAETIIAYRTSRTTTRPNEPAFRRPEDLLRITGFGSATIEALRPYLDFPATRPAGHAP